MNPKLPDSLARAVDANHDQPLRIEGEAGGVFYVMTAAGLSSFVDENTRAALHVGLTASANGEVEEFNVEDIKKQGRERLAKQD